MENRKSEHASIPLLGQREFVEFHRDIIAQQEKTVADLEAGKVKNVGCRMDAFVQNELWDKAFEVGAELFPTLAWIPKKPTASEVIRCTSLTDYGGKRTEGGLESQKKLKNLPVLTTQTLSVGWHSWSEWEEPWKEHPFLQEQKSIPPVLQFLAGFNLQLWHGNEKWSGALEGSIFRAGKGFKGLLCQMEEAVSKDRVQLFDLQGAPWTEEVAQEIARSMYSVPVSDIFAPPAFWGRNELGPLGCMGKNSKHCDWHLLAREESSPLYRASYQPGTGIVVGVDAKPLVGGFSGVVLRQLLPPLRVLLPDCVEGFVVGAVPQLMMQHGFIVKNVGLN